MRILKKEMNPVNRIVAGVLIAIGWIASYSAMYFLAYNAGFSNGNHNVVQAMYASCRTEKPIRFYDDQTKYVCMKVGNM